MDERVFISQISAEDELDFFPSVNGIDIIFFCTSFEHKMHDFSRHSLGIIVHKMHELLYLLMTIQMKTPKL